MKDAKGQSKKAKWVLPTGVFAVLLAIALGIVFFSKPGKLDAFAQCLKEKGAVFYGAFWCPHCQAQKAMFGASQKYLPYFECSTADAKGQIAACKEKNVESYPTWDFPDGSRLTGEVPIATLAEKTSCPAPKEQ